MPEITNQNWMAFMADFEVPENWQEIVRTERLRRFNLNLEKRALEDFEYEDRMITVKEMIAYGQAIMDFTPLYNCYKRVGEAHAFNEYEYGMISKFQDFYKLMNADNLPRYTSWMVYLVGAIRKFASGRFQTWNDPEVIQFIENLLEQAKQSVAAEQKSYDQYLYLLDDES